MSGGVFINYRGEDSHSYGALLYVELSGRFGAELVFLDSESIPAGADFVDELLGRVRSCRALLAVIGPRWLTAAGAGGRRIDDPQDWIRRELAAAFAAGATVIPVLTDGADMPVEAELPADIAALGRCQYRRLRHHDATADLGRICTDVAAADPRLAAAVRRRSEVPHQLPADVSAFTGRAGELADLDRLLAMTTERTDPPGLAGDRPTAVVITAVSGTAGVGKTALAVHWAHRVATQFPDGQLYANLRGFDAGGQVMDPGEAVRGFLDALQVPPQRLPASPEAQAALYRSLLADKQMLVMLDNARDAEQLNLLLPGAPGCLALVTSRNQLTSLVAASAHPLALDVFSEAEARQLLSRRLGPRRVAAEPDAVNEIIDRCARLPLALAVVSARAATHPTFPLTALADELRNAHDRLDALAGGHGANDIRAVFSWSYHTLTPETARLFRLLGLHPGPDISAAAAASLAGLSPRQVRPMLTELAQATLILEHAPARYGFHDLLRLYASELARTVDTDNHRSAAVLRILDHYLHTADTADRLLYPARDPIALAPPQPGVTPEDPLDHERAMAWFVAEHPVLLAAAEKAAGAGLDTQTWQLVWISKTFLLRRGHWHDLFAAGHVALAAARRLADSPAQARAHRLLAFACIRLGRYDDARAHLRHALDLYGQSADGTGQAHTHHDLSRVLELQGRHAEALDQARQALDLYRAAGHRSGEADALNAVGWLYAQLGDYQQALTHCQQALPLHEDTGDRHAEADTWDSLGYVHHHLGHYRQAITCYQHAIRLYRNLSDRYNDADTLTRLGDTHYTRGSLEDARTAWQHALTIFDELDHPDAGPLRAKLHHLDQQHTRAQPSHPT